MFCGNCGSENEKGATFCANCGHQLIDVAEAAGGAGSTGGTGAAPQSQPKNNELFNKIKSLPKTTLIGIGVGVVALVVILCIAIASRNTINLNKFLVVETYGYNGYGRASVDIDWDAIEEKYGDRLKFTKAAEKDFGSTLMYMEPMDFLWDYVDVYIEDSTYLSNGDEVNYVWDVDEDVFEYVNCKIKFKDDSFKAEDLQEIEKFDAFSNLEVTFSGIAPNGYVDGYYNGDELSSYDFDCDKTSGLKNGDTITVSIDESVVERCAENFGKIPQELEKTYTVSGLDEYVTSYDSLTEDFISLVRSEAEDTIYAYAANSYSSSTTLSELIYAGYIMGEAKPDTYSSYYNVLYVIYSGKIANSDGDFNPTFVYYPVEFTDILKTESGISYNRKNGIEGYTVLGSYWSATDGYTNAVKCYAEIVETNKDAYTFECGDGFEKYSQYLVISKLDEISQEYREEAKANAEYLINDYIARNYNSDSVASNLTYEGDYILRSKEDSVDIDDMNRYIVVYSATVSNTRGRFDTTTVYFPVSYAGVVGMSDGTYTSLGGATIEGDSRFPDSYYYTQGYIDGSQMYTDLISANRESYTYEVSSGLEKFGN